GILAAAGARREHDDEVVPGEGGPRCRDAPRRDVGRGGIEPGGDPPDLAQHEMRRGRPEDADADIRLIAGDLLAGDARAAVLAPRRPAVVWSTPSRRAAARSEPSRWTARKKRM